MRSTDVHTYVTSTVIMTEALTSVTGRTITRPITSVAGSRIDDVYGVDGEDGDEDADDDDDDC